MRFGIAVLRQTAIFHGSNLSHQFRKIPSDAHRDEKCLEVCNVYTDIIGPNADVLLVSDEPDISVILSNPAGFNVSVQTVRTFAAVV